MTTSKKEMENTTVISHDIKLPFRWFVSIICVCAMGALMWYDLHIELGNVKETMTTLRHQCVTSNDLSTWALEIKLANNNNTNLVIPPYHDGSYIP